MICKGNENRERVESSCKRNSMLRLRFQSHVCAAFQFVNFDYENVIFIIK